MGVVVSTTVTCDKCYNQLYWRQDLETPGPERFTASISMQSKWARQNGWQVGKKTLCPRCQVKK